MITKVSRTCDTLASFTASRWVTLEPAVSRIGSIGTSSEM